MSDDDCRELGKAYKSTSPMVFRPGGSRPIPGAKEVSDADYSALSPSQNDVNPPQSVSPRMREVLGPRADEFNIRPRDPQPAPVGMIEAIQRAEEASLAELEVPQVPNQASPPDLSCPLKR